jgi:hypothetical protein
MAQQVQVIDAVCAGDHPGHDRGHLAARVRSGRDVQADSVVHQPGQVGGLGQTHDRQQTSTRHQVRVVKGRDDATATMR